MTGKELQKQLEDADMERIGKYTDMFDRILLYTLAVNSMPKAALEGTVDLWEKVVKRGIDGECSRRTDFLEGTRLGRRAKYEKQPDGESMRLEHLKQCAIAKNVIKSNMSQGPPSEENHEENEE